MQQRLFPEFTVHCFWAWCEHVVTDTDPRVAHDAMETHYQQHHRADLDRAVSFVRGMRVYDLEPST